uniref:Uncharacterized protein n=1 Tax=Phasianus colchicus TaxID=9054 RepID=A0A669QYL2_PHACC
TSLNTLKPPHLSHLMYGHKVTLQSIFLICSVILSLRLLEREKLGTTATAKSLLMLIASLHQSPAIKMPTGHRNTLKPSH